MRWVETVCLINDTGDYWASDDCCRSLGHETIRRDCLASDDCCRSLGHDSVRDCSTLDDYQ